MNANPKQTLLYIARVLHYIARELISTDFSMKFLLFGAQFTVFLRVRTQQEDNVAVISEIEAGYLRQRIDRKTFVSFSFFLFFF